jgi:hypothetical protein
VTPPHGRAALLRRYRELVLEEMPCRARAEGSVVVADHCFGRIVLDHAVGGRWYDVLDRRSDRYESEPGAWASASTAAVLERMDTEWLRRLDLDLLADRATPRRLDRAAIGGRLRAMRRLLNELDRLGAVDAERFAKEFATQLVVEREVSPSTWRRASTRTCWRSRPGTFPRTSAGLSARRRPSA